MFSKIVASALLASADGLAVVQRIHKEASGPKIIYGAFGSSVPKYADQLDAQIATWAAQPLAEGRFFFIGDKDFKSTSQDLKGVDCSAEFDDVACKMGYLMTEALKRDADWVVVTQTDMYINTTVYEAQLATEDHTVVNSVGGSFGCGLGGFRAGCDEVTKCGGYCGSAVYAISKPALKAMIAGNDASLIAKMKGFTVDRIPEDMANSCALRQSSVPLHMFETLQCQFFQATGEMATMKEAVMNNLCMMHMTTPKMLHWIQAVVTGDTASEMTIANDIAPGGYCAECAREIEQTLLRNQHWDSSFDSGIPVDECAR